jgi:hypothetical protein
MTAFSVQSLSEKWHTYKLMHVGCKRLFKQCFSIIAKEQWEFVGMGEVDGQGTAIIESRH